MTTEQRRPWSIIRRVAGAVLGLAVEGLLLGVAVLAAIAVAALVLWAA